MVWQIVNFQLDYEHHQNGGTGIQGYRWVTSITKILQKNWLIRISVPVKQALGLSLLVPVRLPGPQLLRSQWATIHNPWDRTFCYSLRVCATFLLSSLFGHWLSMTNCNALHLCPWHLCFSGGYSQYQAPSPASAGGCDGGAGHGHSHGGDGHGHSHQGKQWWHWGSPPWEQASLQWLLETLDLKQAHFTIMVKPKILCKSIIIVNFTMWSWA